jgi:Fe-S cluster assembly protein SufD
VPTLTDNTAITVEAVEALSRRYDEPVWLTEERRAAFRSYTSTPFPTERDELWRYSQIERFALDGLDLVDEPRDRSVPERIEMRVGDSDAEGVLIHKGSGVIRHQANITEPGVVFTDLRTAVVEHEELVRQHLYGVVNATQTKYTALNSALWNNGTFVYVPRDVEVALPLGAFTTADRGGLGLGRTLIVVDVNAKLTFLDEFTSEPFDERMFFDAATEIFLKDGAKLRYVSLQNWSRNVAHIHKQRAHVGRDARLESLTVSLGASTSTSTPSSTTPSTTASPTCCSRALYATRARPSTPASSWSTPVLRRPTPTRPTATCCSTATPTSCRCHSSRSPPTTSSARTAPPPAPCLRTSAST